MKEWLTNGYHDKKKIEEDYRCKVLTREKRDALLAVHDHDRKEAILPSAKDLEFLNKQYHSMSVYVKFGCMMYYNLFLVSLGKTQSTMSCLCK